MAKRWVNPCRWRIAHWSRWSIWPRYLPGEGKVLAPRNRRAAGAYGCYAGFGLPDFGAARPIRRRLRPGEADAGEGLIVCWIVIEIIVYAFLGVNKGRLKWWTILVMLAGVIGLGILAAWIRHEVMWWIAGGAWVVFYMVLGLTATDDPAGLKQRN